MTLARDASSPVLAGSGYLGSSPESFASNSFSPPAGSVIIATAYGTTSYNAWGATPATITDSLGSHLTWTLFLSEAVGATSPGAVWAWWAYTASAPGSMTVTPTLTAGSGQDVYAISVAVDVWTGANTSGPVGATGSGTFTGQNLTQSLTPNASGSALILAAADGEQTGLQTAGTGCYLLDNDANNFLGGEVWYGTSGGFTATTASTAETLAITGGSSSAEFQYIAYEVLAAGASGPSITTTSLPVAQSGVAYSSTVSATGGTTPYTWSISSGSLPGWASLNTSSGAITGTPSSLTVASFTVEVTDHASNTATQPLTLDMLVDGQLGTDARPGEAVPGNAVPGQTAKSSSVSVSAGLATGTGAASRTYTWAAGLATGTGTAQPGSTTPPTLNGVSASTSSQAGHFTDTNGNPKLWVATETWAITNRAGEWNSGNWQADYDAFFSSRAAQGFTVVMTDPVSGPSSGAPYANGNTWDGVTPLVGGSTDPSSAGLNSTFWTRIDYALASAANNGITIGIVVYNGDNINSGYLYDAWTSTQWTAFGALLGARYKSTPNIVWIVGNDAFSPYDDPTWDAILSGIQGTGDTHMFTAWYNPECTSRYASDTSTAEPWGTSNSAFNFCYTYNCGYWLIEYAYGEVANEGSAALLTPAWGDGYFYQGTSGAGYSSTYDRAMRQEWWWTLASGGRGVLGESEEIYQWPSTAPAAVTGEWFFANNTANIVSAFTGLSGWHLLLPDLSSSFVTSGRGTRASGYASGGSGGQYEPAFTNSYVAASMTPAGSLAVCYLPNHTTITVNTSLLATGWSANWVDPVTGTATTAGTSGTYNSTSKGTNSQGDPDWVLVFQVSSAVTANAGLASGTGTASLVYAPVQAGLAHATGSASAVYAPVQAAIAHATGTALVIYATFPAGLASGTGSALSPPAPAVLASGLGTALSATTTSGTSDTASAGLATGTGTAQQVNGLIYAVLATGAGTALNATTSSGTSDTANAGVASGTGTAQQVNGLIYAVLATGAGTAFNATTTSGTSDTANAGLASGTGTASVIYADIQDILASGSGTALDATVFSSGTTTADAGLATGTGTAQVISGLVYAGVASGTGTAQQVNGLTYAGLATGAGTAQPAYATVPAGLAHATGTASVIYPLAQAGLAAGTGTASAAYPLVQASLAHAAGAAQPAYATVPAGLATGTGSAQGVSLAVYAGIAAAAGAALSASTSVSARPNVDYRGSTLSADNTLGGTASVAELDGTLSVVANALGGTASVTTNALGGTVSVLVLEGTAAVTSATLTGTLSVEVNALSGTAVEDQMQEVDITLNEFNDATVTFQILDNSSPMDITGMTVNALFKKTRGDLDSAGTTTTFSSAGGSPDITVNDASTGSCTLAVPDADVIFPNWTFYRIDVVNSGITTTAIFGTVTITQL